MKASGYDKERFPELKGDQFDCVICFEIVREPQECLDCGSLFCNPCIKDWIQKQNSCPMRCDVSKIATITRALNRLYSDLNIKCQYHQNCKKIVKIGDLEDHEKLCQMPDCKNYQFCSNKALQKQNFCGEQCDLFYNMKQNSGNYKNMLIEIQKFLQKNPIQQKIVKKVIQGQNIPVQLYEQPIYGNGNHYFRWSTTKKGLNIDVTNNGLNVYLSESSYMFRTILGDKPFMNGEHYWELTADERTENELKIGVCTQSDFNLNSAFCDYEFGFAYYGLGQLRHNSNSSGGQYGQRFKKEGVLGIYLNMNKGTLTFSLNGKSMGVAYENPVLQVGPIYPAISLLHEAGCKLDSSKPVPNIFK